MTGDALALHLLELLDADDLDGAIDAGLAGFDPHACASLEPAQRERLLAARNRLLDAWAARDRHRARNARLARKAEELRARRQARSAPAPAGKRPALPPAAAAALARARQRAGGGAQ